MAEEETIRCMQLPIEDMQILMPNSAVAEIIGYDPGAVGNSNNGLIWGVISWRGSELPVLSLEALCQRPSGEPGNRSRIAVVYHPDGDPELPYLGILLKDIPRAYLADSVRLEGRGETTDCEYLAFRIEEMVDDYFVPDLDEIFAAARQALQ